VGRAGRRADIPGGVGAKIIHAASQRRHRRPGHDGGTLLLVLTHLPGAATPAAVSPDKLPVLLLAR